LDQIPLSANGKINFDLLPSPDVANLLANGPERGPVTVLESQLLANMQDVLKTNAIGVQDNFFLAGGDSLLGMQLILMLRDKFDVEMTFEQIFEAPTVESLALLIETMRREKRISAIWQDILGHRHELRDDFFDRGGDWDQLAKVSIRISQEFNTPVTTADLLRSPTIGQQAKLTCQIANRNDELLPGVLPLREFEPRQCIFWVHYLTVGLGRALGKERQVVFLMLTSEDTVSLGEKPTLQSIAACFLRKILATQPTGPYTLGGLCIAGILAYEIAIQLRASGHDVSLLVLLDPPGPADLKLSHPMTPKLNHPLYLLKRVRTLGLRSSLRRIGEHLLERSRNTLNLQTRGTETEVAQRMVEAAATAYRPEVYEGKVLLMLASDHPPHVNFLPSWQALISRKLHAQYVVGHHDDLMKAPYVQVIADTITSHIRSSTEQEAMSSI
jgi:thioesterase domain-containing protein/acyl carrier protein